MSEAPPDSIPQSNEPLVLDPAIEKVQNGLNIILLGILIYFFVIVLVLFANPILAMIAGCFTLILGVIGIIRVAEGFKYGIAMRILMALPLLIPFVGLLMLLVINTKATKILREAGLKVGLIGVVTKSSVKLFYITLFACVLTTIVGIVFLPKKHDLSPMEILTKEVNAVNVKLPMVVDEETKLTKVKIEGNMVVYTYVVKDGVNFELGDEQKKQFKDLIRTDLQKRCGSFLKLIRDCDMTLHYVYCQKDVVKVEFDLP